LSRKTSLALAGFCIAIVLVLVLLTKVLWESPPESAAYSFRLPLDGEWMVSQEFGQWSPERCGYHLGEDVRRNRAVAVYAAADGIVKFAGLAELGYGYVVVIEHRLPPNDPAGEYVCTVYGHLGKENLTSIRQIHKDELVGYLSENPEYNNGFIHLHFGIRKGECVTTVIDPRRGGWYYGGYTTIFGECNQTNPVHQQILSEWLNPTTDSNNGDGFIK